jgi:hypothetical protein
VRRIAAALATAGVVLTVLIVAQLVLPGIAAQRLRDRLTRSGTVLHVEVDAFPAIKLLWHQADRVVVRVARYRSGPGQLGSLLDQTADAGSLDASASELDTGLLTLRDATLRKRGDVLTGTALVTESELRSAVPFLDGVQPVPSGNGRLALRGTATLFGVTASIDASVAAQDGRLIVQPDVPFGGLATVTVFSDPHVAVEGISASSAADGFSVSATARLR